MALFAFHQLATDLFQHAGVGLQVGVLDCPVEGNHDLELGVCFVQHAATSQDHGDFVPGHRLAGTVADLPQQGQGLLEVRCPQTPLSRAVCSADTGSGVTLESCT